MGGILDRCDPTFSGEERVGRMGRGRGITGRSGGERRAKEIWIGRVSVGAGELVRKYFSRVWLVFFNVELWEIRFGL